MKLQQVKQGEIFIYRGERYAHDLLARQGGGKIPIVGVDEPHVKKLVNADTEVELWHEDKNVNYPNTVPIKNKVEKFTQLPLDISVPIELDGWGCDDITGMEDNKPHSPNLEDIEINVDLERESIWELGRNLKHRNTIGISPDNDLPE